MRLLPLSLPFLAIATALAAEADALSVRASVSTKTLIEAAAPVFAAAPGGTKLASSFSLTGKIIEGVSAGEVPVGIHDAPLDYVMTEQEPFACA